MKKVINKEPIFIVEKDGFAYFKDKRLTLICRPVKINKDSKYKNYFWEFDYMKNLDWFKKIVALILVNKGNIQFVGMDLDEFNNLGGTPISIDGVEVIDKKDLKKLFK